MQDTIKLPSGKLLRGEEILGICLDIGLNELIILRILNTSKPLTIEDIVMKSGLGRATVISSIKRLHSLGLVERIRERRGGRGRSRILYRAPFPRVSEKIVKELEECSESFRSFIHIVRRRGIHRLVVYPVVPK